MQAVTYMVLGSGVAALLLAWMVLVERQRFRVRRVVLDAGSLGLPPLKILHLTDAHFHGRDRPILRFLQGVRAREDFDLLLLTGDMLDSAAGLESVEEVLGMFAPRIGALAVLGGHDYAHLSALKAYRYLLTHRSQQAFSGPNPADDLADCLRRHGARVLRDASATLAATDGRPFAVAGLRDAFVFEPDVDAAWSGLEPDLPVIAMAHSPDVVWDVCARGARLAFFGHTHGGQVRLPVIGAVVTRSRIPRRLAHGTFRHGNTVFILNNGLGTSPAIPYRLLCPPEVTVAELRTAPDPAELTPIREARLG
ncbi:MAG: hypothetical protein AMK73_08370 [Planctomycetes bacterium SM23_32]|nr:MAG: hypothetical protein AMK73_08370 [Planctomycetes bacterium SM23_32]